MDHVLTKAENEAYFPFGLLINASARTRLNMGAPSAGSAELNAFEQAHFARMLAAILNNEPNRAGGQHHTATAGEIMAAILLHKAYRFVIARYGKIICPGIYSSALGHAQSIFGIDAAENIQSSFLELYPAQGMIDLNQPPLEFLKRDSFSVLNTERALWEMVILQVNHENPALVPYKPLFDDNALQARVPFREFMVCLDTWFEQQPPISGTGMSLMEMLREPIRRCPDSLEGQIEYIMGHWRSLLPPYLYDLWLVTRGVIREETLFRGHGPGPFSAPVFSGDDYVEPEAFTRDEGWMPNVVLMAKLAYVWLDQLSLKYGRRLSYLSDIPDAELDILARWGFNGLWLIGVWERSASSREIKQRMGNPEAAASAYSLYDYTIAQDLGGEAALADLARRAGQRGIRLAGDMVPNHMGIYSKWVIEHPERFLQLRHSPFPAYRFTGPDLSKDQRTSLFIEDGYWTHSDAAVVFKRTDNWTGDSIYIYHGNDGTSMPWNDTAQLDFLRSDTREAVIQTIIQVARRFPIIRFDAAMTLAKRHYQRLWFPKPGDGGAIPSRSEFGMGKDEFDTVFPLEFWREVVDRIALEAPDTLLLAEAFWLMEGYFVRTLGMHRVYNSAFMNMLKMEDNGKYRQTIKNVLEFSPEVLQRFVNFMNNPDEDTAEAQFGKGDKYFGVAALLATMPGLPMFGHGQIEGFSEKYGMEYRRAYKEEVPDGGLIERHEREIFPLMRKRYLFSGAQHFCFYDFTTPDGWVDENVFAYSNRYGSEYGIIVYNNAYATTRGVLHTSTATNVGKGDEKILVRRGLVEALAMDTDARCYSIWRDEQTKLEYLQHNMTLAEQGLHLELSAYACKTFFFVRQIYDTDLSWAKLFESLAGKGTPNIEEAYLEMHLAAILQPFREFMTAGMLEHVLAQKDTKRVLGPWLDKLVSFLAGMNAFLGSRTDATQMACHVERDLREFLKFSGRVSGLKLPDEISAYIHENLSGDGLSPENAARTWRIPLTCILMRSMGALAAAEASPNSAAAHLPWEKISTVKPSPVADSVDATEARGEHTANRWLHDWLLAKPLVEAFTAMDGDAWRGAHDGRIAAVCLKHRARLAALETEIWGPLLFDIFNDETTQAALLVNWYDNRRWINKEQLEYMLFHLFLANMITLNSQKTFAGEKVVALYETIQVLLRTSSDTGYDFDWMLNALK
jgi:glycosidase